MQLSHQTDDIKQAGEVVSKHHPSSTGALAGTDVLSRSVLSTIAELLVRDKCSEI